MRQCWFYRSVYVLVGILSSRERLSKATALAMLKPCATEDSESDNSMELAVVLPLTSEETDVAIVLEEV